MGKQRRKFDTGFKQQIVQEVESSAYSAPNRPVIPGQTGHPIRYNPATVPEQTGHPPYFGVRLS